MNRGLKTLVVLLCSYLSITQSYAQVTAVKFQLKYDTTTCLYNVSLIIGAGSATTVAQRTGFNAQISFVVPSTDTLEIVQRYMPLQNNAAYNGVLPMEWLVSSTVFEPAAQPQSNFFSIIPSLSPTSQYNNLAVNDTIKLFSLRAFRKDGSVVKSCGGNLRFLSPGIDPNSSAPGMGGGDFSHGFTVGNPFQMFPTLLSNVTPPTPALTYINNCSNNIDINLTAKSSACQLPLTYNWSGPGYSSAAEDVFIPSASSFNNGIYNVTVTDNLGCTSTLNITSEIKPDAGPDQVKCGTGNVILSAVNSFSGTWTSKPGNPPNSSLGGTVGGSATVNFSAGASGNYDFIYTTAVCKDTMKVSVASSLSPTISGANSICNGTTTSITTSGGIIYSWSNGGSGPNITVSPGTYTVTVTDAAGCTGSAFKTISSLSVPSASISGANSVCSGSNTSITASGGVGYSWSTGQNTATINVGAGNYTVTVTNAGGCTATAIQNISNIAAPTASIAGANSVCSGSNTSITASGGVGYSWSTGQNTATINVGAGNYTVTVTNAGGCTATAIQNISNIAAPTASIAGANSVCSGSNTSITASGGVGYSWSTGQNTATINVGAGNYTVTVTNAGGCTATAIQNISNIAAPTASIAGANSVCSGSNTSITASGGVGYSWSTGQNTATINVGAGNYTVTVTNAGGCTATAIQNIANLAAPTAFIAGANSVCSGSNTSITASGGVGYSWSTGQNTATINVGAGSYTVTVTNAGGCTATAIQNIANLAAPTAFIAGANSVCSGSNTSITASGGVGYSWSTGQNTATINVGAGSYTVTVTNDGGCTATAIQNIANLAAPTASIAGANSVCSGSNTQSQQVEVSDRGVPQNTATINVGAGN
ncbi:MAG: hypothetical protein IPO98_07645 [Saprospiraceae bacterium]|nr:hypothetical protein [Saprospiraceae bacterium]